jgi:hypothetical protein
MTDRDRARSNGLKAFATVGKVLTRVGWKPTETGVEGQLRINFRGEGIPIVEALATLRIDTERFVMTWTFGERASMARRRQVMEFITRANDGLVTGNFELNLDNGEVRFKNSIDFTNARLTQVVVRNVIQSGMDAVEVYAEGVTEVMAGRRSPKGAIQEIEG